MKRTFLNFLQLILLAICFITGCQGGKDTVSRLEEAETLIYESPDSALRLLESIPHPERLQGKEQADYALLLSLARYRCYIPASSDSLIQIAVQYYKDKDDADKKGMAYYTLGSILEECDTDKSAAVQAYKDAERQVREMKNLDVASRIYSRLGFLNQSSGNYEVAKQYYRQAIAINKKNGNNHSLASNYLNLFRIHYLAAEKDSVAAYTEQLRQIESTLTDSALRSKIHQNIGVYYMYEEDYAKAEQYLTYALQLASNKASPKIWLSLADIYQYNNRQDKADSLYASLALYPDITIRANTYKNLLNGLLQQSSTSLHTLFGQYTAAADSAYKYLYQAELSELQYKYDKVSLEKENTRLYNNWLLSVSGFMVFFILLTLSFPLYYRKKKKELVDLQTSLLLLEEEQRLQNNHTESLNKTIKEYQNKIRRLKETIKRMDTVKEHLHGTETENPEKASSIYHAISTQGLYHPETERTYLAEFLNRLFYGFADRLSNQYPLLKDRDLDICYMLALQLTADEMAKILAISTDSVKRYIRKITKEMQAASCDTMPLDDRINHLKRRT